MLLSDGSVTRHLQLMTGQSVDVQCLEMQSIGVVDASEFPCELGEIVGDTSLVRRQVFLRFPDRLPSSYVYATSWWQEDVVNEYLRCVLYMKIVLFGDERCHLSEMFCKNATSGTRRNPFVCL